ncbi:Hypothetical protein A7982_00522 [Minicystis rosea]|nr:Hypothetical protein A7982_00522 [Minicystis rosea]
MSAWRCWPRAAPSSSTSCGGAAGKVDKRLVRERHGGR